MVKDTTRDTSLPSFQKPEEAQILVHALSFLCFFLIQTSDFSMVNSGWLVTGSIPLIQSITLLGSMGIKISHNIHLYAYPFMHPFHTSEFHVLTLTRTLSTQPLFSSWEAATHQLIALVRTACTVPIWFTRSVRIHSPISSSLESSSCTCSHFIDE